MSALGRGPDEIVWDINAGCHGLHECDRCVCGPVCRFYDDAKAALWARGCKWFVDKGWVKKEVGLCPNQPGGRT